MERVSATERVLDLLIALLNTRTRMSKQQIRQAVKGYHGDDSAFERTFERDKELLRNLGIPLVVETSAVHEDDVGYRIDMDAYQAPDSAFTPEEIGVLSLAATVYNDAQWRTVAGRGVTKMRGLGPGTQEEAPPVTLALRSPEPAFDVLAEAIGKRRAVTFTYAPLHSAPGPRRVEPWRLLARQRAWYLLGRDQDRDAARAFRLSRIVGQVQQAAAAGTYRVPETVPVGALLGGEGTETVTLRLAVAPERAQLLRARGIVVGAAAGRDIVEVVTRDPIRAVQEIASYGADVVLLAPAALRTLVLAQLTAAAGVAGAR